MASGVRSDQQHCSCVCCLPVIHISSWSSWDTSKTSIIAVRSGYSCSACGWVAGGCILTTCPKNTTWVSIIAIALLMQSLVVSETSCDWCSMEFAAVASAILAAWYCTIHNARWSLFRWEARLRLVQYSSRIFFGNAVTTPTLVDSKSSQNLIGICCLMLGMTTKGRPTWTKLYLRMFFPRPFSLCSILVHQTHLRNKTQDSWWTRTMAKGAWAMGNEMTTVQNCLKVSAASCFVSVCRHSSDFCHGSLSLANILTVALLYQGLTAKAQLACPLLVLSHSLNLCSIVACFAMYSAHWTLGSK